MSEKPIAVVVNGAQGRMGQEVVKAVNAAPDLELVAGVDLGDDLEAMVREVAAQVVVDFTQPAVAVENTRTILRSGACPVVGTTGFSREDIAALQSEAAKLGRGGLIAPNFAIGAVLLMKFAAEAARFMPAVEIIELHHDQKLDAPSGTALKTAEFIREAGAESWSAHPDARETVDGARGAHYQGVRVHSVRLPGLVAHEEVIFGGLGQILTIRHDSITRESFMPGVVLAARKVVALDKLYYGLENLL